MFTSLLFMCIFATKYVYKINMVKMRTNIVIDNELISRAILLSQNKTKKAVVEEALRLLVKFKEQLKIRELRGKLNWEGDLHQMRLDS